MSNHIKSVELCSEFLNEGQTQVVARDRDKHGQESFDPRIVGTSATEDAIRSRMTTVGRFDAGALRWTFGSERYFVDVSRLDDVMESVVSEVDGGLGCAVADMRSGALLGVAHHVPYFTHEYLEAVAAASVEMFRGQTVRHIEDLISFKRGRASERLIEEMQMTTRHTIHFMMVLPNHPEAVVVLITSRETSLGMGWSATRRSILTIEPILDSLAD